MLFAVHGLICSGLSVKCRLRGPCYVGAVVINDTVMEPMMPVRGVSFAAMPVCVFQEALFKSIK